MYSVPELWGLPKPTPRWMFGFHVLPRCFRIKSKPTRTESWEGKQAWAEQRDYEWKLNPFVIEVISHLEPKLTGSLAGF
jgi:hypothetical protein